MLQDSMSRISVNSKFLRKKHGFWIEINGLRCEVIFKKVKNLNLRIYNSGEIRLTAPRKMSIGEIEQFFYSKLDWIDKNLRRIKTTPKKELQDVVEGGKFWYFGEEFLVKIFEGEDFCVVARDHDKILQIYLPKIPSQKTLIKKIELWMQFTLEKHTLEIFNHWERILEVSKNTLTIKKMKGKWGYCRHYQKEIALNSQLIHQDPKFIEYVIVHELCHLYHPNHGKEFKKLLERCLPNYKKEILKKCI